jgi:hypothetical protein
MLSPNLSFSVSLFNLYNAVVRRTVFERRS